MKKQEMINWINQASYEQLLEKWRFAPLGDLFFQGEVGEIYKNKMKELRSQLTNRELIKISKRIRWKIS